MLNILSECIERNGSFLEGLIDAVQRPNKLRNERPTNKNVQWSEKLDCWVLVNKNTETVEEESAEESMEELY